MPKMQEAFAKAGKQLAGGPMLGDVTSSSISVWVRTLSPAVVRVVAKNKKGKTVSAEAQSTTESDFSAVVRLKGLTSKSDYTYELFVDDKKISFSDVEFKFHTPEKENSTNARVVFGSCFHRWGLGNMTQTEAILARGADLLLFNGDVAVQDRRARISLHAQDYFLRDMYPAWRKLVAQSPVYVTWDDHDYIYNDAAGLSAKLKVDAVGRDKVWKAFETSWVNPSYGTGTAGVYHSTVVGPAEIIMLDNRYFRDKENGVFLGDEQMKWLKNKLLTSKSKFKILSCGTMWSDYVSKGKDSWGTDAPGHRDEIFKLIMDNNIKGVLLISGDRHGARGFELPMNDNFSFYEFNGASLGGLWGPKATDKKWSTQLYGIALEYAFSEFTFGGTVSNPTVEFNLIGEKGNVHYNRIFTYDELTPKK